MNGEHRSKKVEETIASILSDIQQEKEYQYIHNNKVNRSLCKLQLMRFLL